MRSFFTESEEWARGKRERRPKDQFVTGREREEKEREREEAAGRRGHPQLATISR